MRCDERSITPDRPFTARGVYSAISLWLLPLHQDLIPRIVRVAGVCAHSLGRVQPISHSSPISLKQPRTGFAAYRNSPGWPCRASNVRFFIFPQLFSNSPIQVSSSVTVPSERYIYITLPQDSLHYTNIIHDMIDLPLDIIHHQLISRRIRSYRIRQLLCQCTRRWPASQFGVMGYCRAGRL